MTYEEFLRTKEYRFKPCGFDCEIIHDQAFAFQRDIARWSLKKGKSANFLDTGLGKTLISLIWADEVAKHTGGKILIVAPLAVSKQTVREGVKFGFEVNPVRAMSEVKSGINITNYEMLHHFDLSAFDGAVLDESSIVKSFSGKTTQYLIDAVRDTPYRLCATATPSPNDYQELGNHAEILGVCTRSEMLSEFFVHDGGDTAKWRLKGHAEKDFWKWIASWAAVVKNPADIGYDGRAYELPLLKTEIHVVESENDGYALVPEVAQTLDERRRARKESMDKRVAVAKEIADSVDTCLIWCDYNAEGKALNKAIKDSVEVCGSDTPEFKEKSLLGFADGDIKTLISKSKIAGFGLNWQQCNTVVFCGLSDSYESYYQAIRRCWRFGQERPVTVHIIISEKEMSVLENIRRKEARAEEMSRNMVALTAGAMRNEIHKTTRQSIAYTPDKIMILPDWLKEGA